ncbi:MAG: single-stranded-DNA-specific exonuclease RecJ, partial [Candidatus Marinimicrobia bacterium]|nr:single-stranded-DNA-specific exonuclease RecJ [Candidatus Neomarinimicrobiota bacterium]
MRWIFPSPDPEIMIELMEKYQIPEVIAQLMTARGLYETNKVKTFFSPDISQLHDPFLMKHLGRATDRVIKNIKSKSPIFVFGDYDVDGTTGASLLYAGLSTLGANVRTYIPNREKEGYGLSELGIDKAWKLGADLFITC